MLDDTGAASFEELISKTRERAAQKAAAAQPQAEPNVDQQLHSEAAAVPAQPEAAMQPCEAPGSSQPPQVSIGKAPPAVDGGSADRLADSIGSRGQEQEDGSNGDIRRFSGRPVDSNVQQQDGPGDAVQGKYSAQIQPTCPGQHSTATPGGSTCADDADAPPDGDGLRDKAGTGAVPMHAADAAGVELRIDDPIEEVPDSDPER